jgi:hypothetical protein
LAGDGFIEARRRWEPHPRHHGIKPPRVFQLPFERNPQSCAPANAAAADVIIANTEPMFNQRDPSVERRALHTLILMSLPCHGAAAQYSGYRNRDKWPETFKI